MCFNNIPLGSNLITFIGGYHTSPTLSYRTRRTFLELCGGGCGGGGDRGGRGHGRGRGRGRRRRLRRRRRITNRRNEK